MYVCVCVHARARQVFVVHVQFNSWCLLQNTKLVSKYQTNLFSLITIVCISLHNYVVNVIAAFIMYSVGPQLINHVCKTVCTTID